MKSPSAINPIKKALVVTFAFAIAVVGLLVWINNQ